MTTDTTLEWWQQDGGTAYTRRNPVTDADVEARVKALSRVWERGFDSKPPPGSILEIGSGPGANLRALQRVTYWQGSSASLYAVEPNEAARRLSAEVIGPDRVFDGHACAIPAADASFSMCMSAGVLIHVDPARLCDAMIEIARVARHYVLAIEYFAPACQPVQYYDAERIWKNDFGRLYVEQVGLRPLCHDFFWKPGGDGYDNCVAWLLEKPADWRIPTGAP